MKRKFSRRGVIKRAAVAAVLLALAALAVIALARKEHTEPKQESAVPEPTASPEPDVETQARAILSQMSLHEKICQLLVMEPEYLPDAAGTVRSVTPAIEQSLRDYPVGGIILMPTNIHSAEQVKNLTAALQNVSSLPMILCVDEEGGDVSRLAVKCGTTKLENMFVYRGDGPGVARANGRTLGNDLKQFGINTDLAPVADVWSNPDNEVIGERAYSDDFEQASELVAAAVRGFHDSGTVCCLKHFPGHGSTRTDTHKEAAFVDATLDELRERELMSFQSGIDAGADMVMVGHLTVPDIDDEIATYSHEIVTELLRGEMGFDGVVITDGLEMLAAGTEPDSRKALRALQAGCDLLLGLHDVPETVEGLEQAVADGTLTEAELDAHVLRVLVLKLRSGILVQ